MLQPYQVHRNITLLASALRTAGVHSVSLDYFGSAGQGEGMDFKVVWDSGTALLATDDEHALGTVIYTSVLSKTVNGKVIDELVQRQASLTDVVYEMCWQALDQAGYKNWTKDDGAKGRFTAHSSGYARVEHTVIKVEHHRRIITLDATFNHWNNIQSIAAVLTSIGSPKGSVYYTMAGAHKNLNHVDLGSPDLEVKAKTTFVDFVDNYLDSSGKPLTKNRRLDLRTALAQVLWTTVRESGCIEIPNTRYRTCVLSVSASGTAELDYVDHVSVEAPPATHYLGNPEAFPTAAQASRVTSSLSL